MASLPLISVIVPVYGVEAYLHECVDSILAQTYANLEIILVDDGSQDACPAICSEYAVRDGRVRVIRRANGGLSAARNTGLEAAIGAYLGFVDADDFIEPQMYETLLDAIAAGGTDIACCLYEKFGRVSTAYPACPAEKPVVSSADAVRYLLHDQLSGAVWDKLYRRELWDNLRFPEGRRYEDIFLSWRVLSAAKAVALAPEYLYHYRVRQGSITTDRGLGGIVDACIARMERYKALRERYPESRRAMMKKLFRTIREMESRLSLAAPDEIQSYATDIHRIHAFLLRYHIKV